jgi:hypothetical protein
MKELVLAVYETRSAARAAVEDLQVARVPSAIVHPNVTWELVDPDHRSITISVDGQHATAVTAILALQAPVRLEEAALP